ncbi:MAG TPA: hypothetical protein VKA91_02150, partial [Nitrososphaeraceae archaeon]|nr:hypothetical protein [Nitrososphaeraceae archaeon]
MNNDRYLRRKDKTSSETVKTLKGLIRSMSILAQLKKRRTIKLSVVFAAVIYLVIIASQSVSIVNRAYAETGKGEDIFKVILTIFGV